MDDALVPPCSSTPNWMHVWVVMQTLEWSLVTWKMCSFLRQRTICDRSQRWKPILKRTWKNGYELSKSNPAPLSCLMAFDVHCKIKIRSTFRLCFSPPHQVQAEPDIAQSKAIRPSGEQRRCDCGLHANPPLPVSPPEITAAERRARRVRLAQMWRHLVFKSQNT